MSTVEGRCQHASNLLTYCKSLSTGQKGVVDRSEKFLPLGKNLSTVQTKVVDKSSIFGLLFILPCPFGLLHHLPTSKELALEFLSL